MRLTEQERIARLWAGCNRAGEHECWPWARAAKRDGYGYFTFEVGGKVKTVAAHRVAFYVANGRWPGRGMDTMHTCDNKLCCNPAHLVEGTRSQNMKDAHARGLYTRPVGFVGSKHPRSVLSEPDIPVIRECHERGEPYVRIAERYGVNRATIRGAVLGTTWSHVSRSAPAKKRERV